MIATYAKTPSYCNPTRLAHALMTNANVKDANEYRELGRGTIQRPV